MSAPACTVVVPAHGRPGSLRRCLGALARLRAPEGGHEVLVVDDGSPEPLRPVVEEFRDRLPVRSLRQPNAGPAAARNRGAEESEARFLAFTDDDCEPEPDWLVRLVEAAAAEPEGMVGGRTVNALPRNPWSDASQQLVTYLYHYYLPDRPGAFLTSNNLAVERRAFLDAGGFSERFPDAAAEDRELCRRWRRRGGRLVHVPEAVVRHRHVLGPISFLEQHYRYGRGARRLRESAEGGADLEPLSFYVDLVRWPLRRGVSPGAMGRAAILALSQLANVAGYVAAALGARLVRT